MSEFMARIADVDLLMLTDWELGAPFRALIIGSDADDMGAKINRLGDRLERGGHLVLNQSGGQPVAIPLQPGGTCVPVAPMANRSVLGHSGLVECRVTPAGEWANPANRVFLPSPIGDEWPSSADVVRNSAKYVYADGGRWCVNTDTSDEGDLKLYFDCVDDELLVIEYEFDVTAIAGASQALTINAVLPTGAASTYTWPLTSATVVGRGRYVSALRVPTSTAKRGYLHITTANHAGAVKAYLEKVRVGVKTVAHERILPGAPSTLESSLPYGWSAQTVAGVTWSYTAGKFVLTAAPNAADAAYLNYGLDEVDEGVDGFFPVVAGRRYGWRATLAVTSRTDGTVSTALWWYRADGTSAGTASLLSVSAVYGETTSYGEATAPEGAAYATFVLGCTSGATLVATLKDVDFGEHIMEAPALMHLSRIGGEAPAALHVGADVDLESVARVWAASVQPDDGQPIVWESEAVTTTAGGVTVWGTDQANAKAHGGHYRQSDNSSGIAGYLPDLSRKAPGTYAVFPKAWVDAGTGYVAGAYYGAEWVAVVSTAAQYHYAGQTTLPIVRGLPGVGDYPYVTMAAPNGGNIASDCFVLLRLPCALYANPSLSAGVTAIEVDEAGNVFVAGAVDAANCWSAALAATKRDVLAVLADRVNTDWEPTHLVRHEVYALERRSLWK